MEKIVTYVLSGSSQRLQTDESNVDILLADRKPQEKISVLPGPLTGFILYMSAIQGHYGKNKVDPTLQDNVEIPYKWMEYIYHARSTDDLHSSTQSGLIQEDKIRKKKVKRYSSQP